MNTKIAAMMVQVLQKDSQPEKAAKKKKNYLSNFGKNNLEYVFMAKLRLTLFEAELLPLDLVYWYLIFQMLTKNTHKQN